MSVQLSERHGVNPSVVLCFYCNESMGVVLLGKLKGDVEAPRQGVFDHTPCDTCKERMEMGVLLISVRDGDENKDNPYRTGGWVIIKDEAIRRMIETEELVNSIIKRRVSFVPDAVWDLLGIPRGETAPSCQMHTGDFKVDKDGDPGEEIWCTEVATHLYEDTRCCDGCAKKMREEGFVVTPIEGT